MILVMVILMNLELIFLAGTFRIMLTFCYWKKWQVIMSKIILVVSSGAYLYVGCDVILSGLDLTFKVSS